MRKRSFYKDLSLVRCAVTSAPLMLAALAAQDLSAQLTINVTNITQLRTAISTVNASGTNDTINIAAGSYLIPSGSAEDANADGDLDINKAAGTLTINGAGSGSTFLSGDLVDRFFHVVDATSVSINDVTIRNGAANNNGTSTIVEGRGGGILVDAGDLLMQDCVLENNLAFGSPGISGIAGTGAGINGGDGGDGIGAAGGAIYMEGGGDLTLTSVSFLGNAANGGDGGAGGQGMDVPGIGVGGAGGEGGSGGYAVGGAIYMVGGTTAISGCTFDGNLASGGGGGDGGRGGNNSISASRTGGDGGGGGGGGIGFGAGVNVVFGTFSLTACTVRNCSAIGGSGGAGGTAGFGYDQDGDGGAGGYGNFAIAGGVYVDNSLATITRSTINGNSATGGSGGSGGDSDGTTASTAGNGGAGGSGADGRGGGIACETGSLLLVSSTVSDNTAEGGAGGDGGSGSNPIGTSASGDGGDGGDGQAGVGGALRGNFSTIDVDNSTVAGNTAIAGNGGVGGAAGAGGGGTSGLSGNNGVGSGGGIQANGGSAEADSSIFADNTAFTGPDADTALTAGSSLFETTPTGTVTLSGTGANIIGSDPGLSALGSFGGPTQTRRIAENSVARNAGSNSLALSSDQRGEDRNDGNGVDMGALELTPGVDTGGGGGGGDGGGGDEGGCSTEDSRSPWWSLAAMLAPITLLARRLRRI